MISVRLQKDEVSPDIRRLMREASTDGALGKVLGRAVANELRLHYREVDKANPNKLGGTRTNFYSRVAESVNSPESSGGEIRVRITHPAIAQKVHGGTIRPSKAKNIAIPIDAEAHGKSPRVFSGLQFFMPGGVKLLGLRENGGMRALYVLKDEVYQDPDPNALPTTERMERALRRAGQMWAERRGKS